MATYNQSYFQKQSDSYSFNQERQKIFNYHLKKILTIKTENQNKIKTVRDYLAYRKDPTHQQAMKI